MKMKIKWFCVIIGVLILLSSIGFSYSSGTSSLNIDYSLVVTDETGTGIVYTPECLVDCHMPIKIKYSGSLTPVAVTINPYTKSNFDWNFIGTALSSVDVKILTTEKYNQTTTTNVCTADNFTFDNITYQGERCNTTNKITEQTRNVWVDANKGFTLTKNAYTYLDIIGKRKASTSSVATDFIPKIYGLSMTELAWFNSTWAKKRIITVNNTLAAQEGTPLLVNMTTANTSSKGGFVKNDFTGLQVNCGDIRITDSAETTSKNYDVDECGTNTLVWYNGDSNLVSGISTNYIYYNNSAATDGRSNPYSAKSSIIAHFNGTLINSVPSPANGTHVGGGATAYASTGIFGTDVYCDGEGGYDFGSGTNVQFGASNDLWVEFWWKSAASGSNYRIISKWGAEADIGGLMIRQNSGNGVEISAGSATGVNNSISISDGNWHYIVFRLNRTEARVNVYVDTILVINLSQTGTVTTNGNFRLCYPHFGGEIGKGWMDELRVYKDWTPTGDYMKFMYNQGIVTLGAEEGQVSPYISLLFNFSSINFGSLPHNTTNNPSLNSYRIDVNTSGCTNSYIEFDAPATPLTYSAYTIANVNFKFNYTKNTTPSPTLNTLDNSYNVSVVNNDIIYPFYFLSVPAKKEAGAYSTTHVITGVCV